MLIEATSALSLDNESDVDVLISIGAFGTT
jgi:hypothetical protein